MTLTAATLPPGWRCPLAELPADGCVCDVLLPHGAVCERITYRHCLRWLIRGTFPLDAQVVGWRLSKEE